MCLFLALNRQKLRSAFQSPKKGTPEYRKLAEQKVLEQGAKRRLEKATKELNITVNLTLLNL